MNERDWEILIDIKAKSLPITVNDVVKCCGAIVTSYINGQNLIDENDFNYLTKNDGFTAIIQGRYIIFYDDAIKSEERKRMAIMHELGHIYGRHLVTESDVFDGRATIFNNTSVKAPNIVEESANNFALKVLAPACVLWGLKITKASDIGLLCKIPDAAAKQRADRMKVLYQRENEFLAYRGKTCFLQSPLERRVYEQFSDFIIVEKKKMNK
ncbi:MAG: ImmA/IrrE family metallo-endopeptidase [Bacillota bacterium]|nr:ImmA/IrrE family metallo-endopeptidase [Bacillota bacterium]